ncbi:maleylpyruvate isomerase family mycothiol-dependent enzyme [Streptomyces endophytica]|uniref:Maleylpyruvate isomerase family mycothiol-dependent enzyme n=1 Tax=Streptomyces endophytica TaxID=2991496 RepID=A0ABY6P8I4_9ACTN|nr:maleylpyruvate isomerase family mycothiol-dependent enzyme [Streptomyces endophytica]UZJ30124.1 maleylpyruvate isomerase family mycothiol-dependent enzyme [Streptomyces endophytica]
MSYDRHCSEIVAQTALLVSHVEGAELATPVPACPGWNLGQLLRHLGEAHRWVETIVRTRATGPVSEERINNVSDATDQDPAELAGWLTEGAGQTGGRVADGGAGGRGVDRGPGGTPVFWARRMTHETVVHRADAAFAVGADFTVDDAVAADALDEWMSFGHLPPVFETRPDLPALLAGGRTLCFRATGTAPDAGAEWLVGLDGDTLASRRGRGPATVTARGPLADLLLFVYGRRFAPGGPGGDVEVVGDEALLDAWLDATSFWLRE